MGCRAEQGGREQGRDAVQGKQGSARVGPRGKYRGVGSAGQGGAGVLQAKGWASRVHQRVWEVPDLPCGEGAMRAARIGRGFSALFALLIWAMRSVQGTEHWVARASGALRLAARAMGVDTVREVRRGGCGGQLGGQQGRERENREGERARRLSRGGQWACRARTGCARDALQGGASRTGMRAQGIARGGSARRGHRGEGRPTILLPRCGFLVYPRERRYLDNLGSAHPREKFRTGRR